MFKVNNKDTGTTSCSSVFIADLEQVSITGKWKWENTEQKISIFGNSFIFFFIFEWYFPKYFNIPSKKDNLVLFG